MSVPAKTPMEIRRFKTVVSVVSGVSDARLFSISPACRQGVLSRAVSNRAYIFVFMVFSCLKIRKGYS